VASISLKNIVKQFGDVTVVDKLNMEVDEGEFIVLVGASGCGKSTTLRMIAGLETPTSGDILIGGKNVIDAPPAERDIAMVFQNYALYPHMSVAQNMSFSLRLAKVADDKIAARVNEAARILGIEHLLARKPKELSGGQRQRVAMGRAIVREPKVFLFDEPLSNLDAKLRGQMRVELALLHERLKKTVIYVTHDQVEAMTLADRIVVFDKGRIQQIGAPSEVFNRPANLFVAGFIGSPTMNFARAHLQLHGTDLHFEGNGFSLPVPSRQIETLSGRVNTEVILGIRPQDIRWCRNGVQHEPFGLSLQVDVSEYLGTETVLVCSNPASPTDKFTVCVPGQHKIHSHQNHGFALNGDALHVFDAASGNNISLP
jgi:ABC-type sugar transport system ATPase subunit